MAVLVNFKICDNASECGGVAVCPTGALSWNDKKEKIEIDNDKCISCGACERECPVGAITVVRTEEEYARKKKEIEDDTRTIKDLFVDRYGATPLSEFFIITEDDVDSKINNGIVLLECYEDDSIQCLLKSIPIKDITDNIDEELMFYKVSVGDKLKKKYDIKELPCLLIFKDKKILGKIEGYYSVDQQEELIDEIKKLF